MAKCGVCGKTVRSGKVLCMPCASSIMTCGHPERVCRDCCLYVVQMARRRDIPRTAVCVSCCR